MVGADGNIYTLVSPDGGDVRLIGLSPEVASGQAQPAKVLDVVVHDDCTSKLYAYKDGLVVRSQERSYARYYSYGGKDLGDATIQDFHDERVGADGHLFVPDQTHVSMYDPRTGETDWTSKVSTSTADVQNTAVFPAPAGGVVALVREQKMYSDGVPWTPETYINTIVRLNQNGQRIGNPIHLPSTDANGKKYGATQLSVNSNGEIVVARVFYADNPYSSQDLPGVIIGVFGTDGIITSKSATFNPGISEEEQSGFYLDIGTAHDLTTSANTLYVSGKCTGDCTDTDSKLYAVELDGVGVEYPRGAVLNKSPRPSASYVALGDSFSSGEGVEPFESGTDIPGVNTCHRSEDAYANLIAGSSPNIPSLGSDGFRACSGAVTTNVTDLPQWNEGIQLDLWPDETTQVVTMTIGGNDIGFAQFAEKCVLETCEIGSNPYNTALGKINNELPSKLEDAYKRVLAYAPNAEVYVVGYPQVIDNKSSTDPDDIRCVYMRDGSTKWADARGAHDITKKLNEAIQDKVEYVQSLNVDNQRLRFVDVNGEGSPFVGHEICGTSATSWFQNLDQYMNNAAYVFHPNAYGQEGYAAIIAAEINAG